MEPPVSVPRASGASKAATAAAEPPPEPPGMRSRSHGLWVGPNAECSVEEPMANSSRLVLPRIGILAARRRSTTVASYGLCQPSRILEPAVGGWPTVTIRSLTAIGTPASTCSSSAAGPPAARIASTSAATARASSALTCRKAWTWPSTAAMRSRCAWVTSTAVISRAASFSASAAAERRNSSGVVSVMVLVLIQDCRDLEAALIRVGGSGKRLLGREGVAHNVLAEHVGQRDRVGRGRDVITGGFTDGLNRLHDDGEFAGHSVQLFSTHLDVRETREMRDVVAVDRSHGSPLQVRIIFRPSLRVQNACHLPAPGRTILWLLARPPHRPPPLASSGREP